jgi:hypothetical protein
LILGGGGVKGVVGQLDHGTNELEKGL